VCLLVVASRVLPGVPVLVGANRDEFLTRPSTPVTVLREASPRVIGGRDNQAGGTWLALNENGVFAGLTNQPRPEGRDDSRRSRGALPLALAQHFRAASAVEDLMARFDPADYNGSWLLVGDRDDLYSVDFTESTGPRAVSLPPGIHALENRPFDDHSAKATYVRQSITTLSGDPTAATATLSSVLADHHIADPGRERPETSANCVHMEGYGTRSSCIVRVTASVEDRPRMWVADGPPCRSGFEEVSALWSRPALEHGPA